MDRGKVPQEIQLKSQTVENLNSLMANGAQISFLRPDGSLSAIPDHCPLTPVIRVSIRPASLENPKSALLGTEETTLYALLDTGADLVYIDKYFAERHGYLSNSTAMVQGASLTSEEKIYKALFKLCDLKSHSTQSADFTSAPLRENGRKFDVIVGMQLLSNGMLVMDFDSGVYRFNFTS
jgi:hypothetical protein